MPEVAENTIVSEEIINMTVNGDSVQLRIHSNWTLQYVLKPFVLKEPAAPAR
jgi:hypothetical protein